MPKVIEKSENATIVNGVVLTEKAIAELEVWQKNNNNGLNMHRETLSDAICFLATNLAELDYNPEIPIMLEALGYLRESLKNLLKP